MLKKITVYHILALVVVLAVLATSIVFCVRFKDRDMIDAGDQLYAYINAAQLFQLAQIVGQDRLEMGQPLQPGETASNYTEATYGADLLGDYILQGTPGNYLITFGENSQPVKIEYNQRDEYVTLPRGAQ